MACIMYLLRALGIAGEGRISVKNMETYKEHILNKVKRG